MSLLCYSIRDYDSIVGYVRLFSKFTISTAAFQHVRLASAHLEVSEGDTKGLVICGTLPQRREITVRMIIYSL